MLRLKLIVRKKFNVKYEESKYQIFGKDITVDGIALPPAVKIQNEYFPLVDQFFEEINKDPFLVGIYAKDETIQGKTHEEYSRFTRDYCEKMKFVLSNNFETYNYIPRPIA